ncbi:hypothetical protein KC644_04400, partial [Candidatus Berkelbacteria bacterium]|nr:hypothetical protein [Candidatus Berkelbacteria bacterium]
GLVVRQETARVEKDNSLLYEMTYLGREIRINDILVAKPVFMSENDEFFAYIYERPWVKISIDEMKKDLQIADFKKSVASMLADLNITGSIRKIFAPNASAKAIEFRNPITRGFADKNKLPDLKLVDRSNKKE